VPHRALGQNSQPFEASDFMSLFPAHSGDWKLVAAYPRLRSVSIGDDSATASAHYRHAEHVIVISLLDVRIMSGAFACDPSLAGTHELPDGTMIVERVQGRWVQERAFHPPYNDRVVGGFSYNMLIDPQALPRTDDCAMSLTLLLGNGILATMKGPPDTTLVMLKAVLAGIDLDRAEGLVGGIGTSAP